VNGIPVFLTEQQILIIHRKVTEAFGGDTSLRDLRLLSSATAVAAASFDGRLLHDSIPAMAGAYLFHLCKNHPFVDGNKRTALTAAEVFLTINAWRLKASDGDVEEVTMGIADGTLAKRDVLVFMQNHCRPM
jgi:death-on-curing protein